MTNFNNWTIGQARLSSVGDIVSNDSDKATEYTEQYTVILASPDSVANATTVEGIPSIGDRSSIVGLTHLRVSNIRYTRVDTASSAWHIDVTYGIPGRGRRPLLDEDNDSDYISVSWGVNEITSDICYDINNTPVLNSAGDPFDSVPQKTEFVPHITIVRREANLPNLQLNGTVNADDIQVLGVSFVKNCARLKISVELTQNIKPYEVRYEIIGMRNFAPAEGYNTGMFEDWGWDIPMVECGYQFYDENGVLRKFTVTGDDGLPRDVSCPQLLDFKGQDARGRNPHIKRIEPYEKKSWEELNFPTTASEIIITE